MGDSIEDALTLAREGRAVDEPKRAAIGTLAEEAWADVATDGEAGGARFDLTDVSLLD